MDARNPERAGGRGGQPQGLPLQVDVVWRPRPFTTAGSGCDGGDGCGRDARAPNRRRLPAQGEARAESEAPAKAVAAPTVIDLRRAAIGGGHARAAGRPQGAPLQVSMPRWGQMRAGRPRTERGPAAGCAVNGPSGNSIRRSRQQAPNRVGAPLVGARNPERAGNHKGGQPQGLPLQKLSRFGRVRVGDDSGTPAHRTGASRRVRGQRPVGKFHTTIASTGPKSCRGAPCGRPKPRTGGERGRATTRVAPTEIVAVWSGSCRR